MAIFHLLKFLSFFLASKAENAVNGTSGEQFIESSLDYLEREAIVTAIIAPHVCGQVEFQGSWWSARCLQDVILPPGEIVYVVGRRNLTLLVEPAIFPKFRTRSQK